MGFESETRSLEDQMRQSPPPLRQMLSTLDWSDVLVKFVLFFFGIVLWSKGLPFYVSYILPLAWVLDGGLRRFGNIIKEPLVIAILIFCIVLALGILWSDSPKFGFKVWKRYFAFLFFIPYLSLLNKIRLPWAIGGLMMGYFGVLLAGLYQWLIMETQGIPSLELSYTSLSLILGVGVILALYLGSINNRKTGLFLWLLAVFLLFIQFNQNGRIALLATILASLLLIFIRYKTETKMLLSIGASLVIVVGVFSYNNYRFQERLAQAERDIQLSTQGKYDTSLGYRLAMWDVGLHGIKERPILGHGTGMAATYFDNTVETYKDGLYKDLPKFLKTYHYHNDWIEIGMHTGMLGLLAYALLLWNWFRTLRAHQLTVLGAAFVCFVFLSGLGETLVFFRQTLYLLLAITAICICWKKMDKI